jgi:hypothetical protein
MCQVRNVPIDNQKGPLEKASLVHCVIVRLICLILCLQICIFPVCVKQRGKF